MGTRKLQQVAIIPVEFIGQRIKGYYNRWYYYKL